MARKMDRPGMSGNRPVAAGCTPFVDRAKDPSHHRRKEGRDGEDTTLAGKGAARPPAQPRCRAPARALSRHAAHPRVRGSRAEGPRAEAGAGRDPPLDRAGGGGGRGVPQPGAVRHPAVDAPGARAHDRQGRRYARHDARAVRPRGRHLPRQGRLHAHRRFQGRHAGSQRRRRRQHPHRRRRGACGAAEEGARGRHLHLRRRGDQPRPLPRRAQLGRRVEIADPVRVRGQRLCRHHAHASDDVRRGPGGARRELRHSGGDGRRQRSAGRRRDGAAAARGDPRRRRPALPAVQYLPSHRPYRRRCGRLSQQGGSRDGLEERSGGAHARSVGHRRRRVGRYRRGRAGRARGDRCCVRGGQGLALSAARRVRSRTCRMSAIRSGRPSDAAPDLRRRGPRGHRRGDAARRECVGRRRGPRPRRRVRPVQGDSWRSSGPSALQTPPSPRPASWVRPSAPP